MFPIDLAMARVIAEYGDAGNFSIPVRQLVATRHSFRMALIL